MTETKGRTGPPALAKTWGGYASRLMPRPDPGKGLPAGGWLAASFEKQGGRGGVRFWYTECFSLWILHVLVLIVDCGLSCFSQWNHSHWTEGHPTKGGQVQLCSSSCNGLTSGVAWGSGPNPTGRSSLQVCLCKSSQILGPKRPFLALNQRRGVRGRDCNLLGIVSTPRSLFGSTIWVDFEKYARRLFGPVRPEATLDLQRWPKLEGGTHQDWCPDLTQGQGYQLVVGWRLALKSKGRGGVRFWYTECFSLWILHVLVLIVDCGLSCFSQWNHSHWTEGRPLKEERSSCAPQVAMGWPVGWPGEVGPTQQVGALCRYVYANPVRYIFGQ